MPAARGAAKLGEMDGPAGSEVFRIALEAAPAGMIVTDREGAIVLANARVEQIFGYRREELIGRPIEQLVPEALRARHHAWREALRAPTGARTMGEGREVHGVRRDGTLVPIEVGLTPLRSPDGDFMLSSIADVSERRAERDRAFLLELAELARACTTGHAVLSAVMQPVAAYFGAARCSFVELDHARDTATLYAYRGPALPVVPEVVPITAMGPLLRAELGRGRIVAIDDCEIDPRLDGEMRTMYRARKLRATVAIPRLHGERWVGQLVMSDEAPRRWQPHELALLRLIAERVWAWVEQLQLLERLAQQEVALAVARSEAKLSVLVDSITDYAIIMLDADGAIATWNRGAERLRGYTAEEAIGQPVAMFWPTEDRARGVPEAALAQARALGRCEQEGWRVRKDGSRFWAQGVITAVRGPAGAVEGFAKVTTDVTERRERDEALRQQQAALARSLGEREVLLQEIHHRVKNNLQVIASLINMQARRLPAGTARDALDECQTRVFAIALIHGTLYESRDYAAVRFADYARALATNVLRVAATSSDRIGLALDIADLALPIDRAIPAALIMNELITNAVKHAFPDGRAGVVAVRLAAVDGDRLALTVRDDGVGLPAGFTLSGLRSLGLLLVQTLCDQLRGELVVLPGPGAGFEISFSNQG